MKQALGGVSGHFDQMLAEERYHIRRNLYQALEWISGIRSSGEIDRLSDVLVIEMVYRYREHAGHTPEYID